VLFILDIAAIYLGKESLFNIDYIKRSRLWVLLSWATISAMTGLIGISLTVLQPTIAAAIGVAVSWPLLVNTFLGGRSNMGKEGGDETESIPLSEVNSMESTPRPEGNQS
jgi:hypothetical protein